MPENAHERAAANTTSLPARSETIAFFGNFGTRNLGNELTLQAIIQNTRRYVPSAKVECICTAPENIPELHGIPAFQMSYRFGKTASRTRGRDNPVVRLVRRLAVRLPLELVEWVKAFRKLKDTSMLVMTGTGMLSDFGIGPLDLHYEILKWSIVARLRGCKLLFVSVGAGPIAHPLSRWIVKSALSLANYRSYRDRFSQQYLESIGFNTSKDRVYPDLVFSLAPSETHAAADRADSARVSVVGMGLMDYYGEHTSPEDGERIYRRYVERLALFASWLLEHQYSLRLLVGDLSFDLRVRHDLLEILERSGVKIEPGRIIDEPLSSTQQLYAQLAQTDLVVATRFHNVLLALMLNRPVVALSYHDKVRALMAESGLADYCEDATELDVSSLIDRFTRLAERSELLRASMKGKTDEYRRALDEQYIQIFGQVGTGHLHAAA
jgi:polysaccharide pyruvyl transferase WcaK-like protein